MAGQQKSRCRPRQKKGHRRPEPQEPGISRSKRAPEHTKSMESAWESCTSIDLSTSVDSDSDNGVLIGDHGFDSGSECSDTSVIVFKGRGKRSANKQLVWPADSDLPHHIFMRGALEEGDLPRSTSPGSHLSPGTERSTCSPIPSFNNINLTFPDTPVPHLSRCPLQLSSPESHSPQGVRLDSPDPVLSDISNPALDSPESFSSWLPSRICSPNFLLSEDSDSTFAPSLASLSSWHPPPSSTAGSPSLDRENSEQTERLLTPSPPQSHNSSHTSSPTASPGTLRVSSVSQQESSLHLANTVPQSNTSVDEMRPAHIFPPNIPADGAGTATGIQDTAPPRTLNPPPPPPVTSAPPRTLEPQVPRATRSVGQSRQVTRIPRHQQTQTRQAPGPSSQQQAQAALPASNVTQNVYFTDPRVPYAHPSPQSYAAVHPQSYGAVQTVPVSNTTYLLPHPQLTYGAYYHTGPVSAHNTADTVGAYYRQARANSAKAQKEAEEAAARQKRANEAAAIAAGGWNTMYFSGGEDTRQTMIRAGLNGVSCEVGDWKWVGEPGNGGFRICEVRKKQNVQVPPGAASLTPALAWHLMQGVSGAPSWGYGPVHGTFEPPRPTGPNGLPAYINSTQAPAYPPVVGCTCPLCLPPWPHWGPGGGNYGY